MLAFEIHSEDRRIIVLATRFKDGEMFWRSLQVIGRDIFIFLFFFLYSFACSFHMSLVSLFLCNVISHFPNGFKYVSVSH